MNMSRVVLATALVLALGVPVCAQRGMRAFGGRPMGRSAAPMGFARAPQRQFFAPRPAMGMRPAFGPQRRSVVTFGHINHGPVFFTPGFGHRFDHFHHRRFFVYTAPYYYYPAYYPSYYGNYGYPYYSYASQATDPSADTSYYTALSSQMSQLSSEIQQLRDDNDSLRSSLEQQRRPEPPRPVETKSANEPATVLVYRDGHRAEVQSYAIVGPTLWLLSSTRATKILLADLDLDQTVKVNEDRGVSFLIPK